MEAFIVTTISLYLVLCLVAATVVVGIFTYNEVKGLYNPKYIRGKGGNKFVVVLARLVMYAVPIANLITLYAIIKQYRWIKKQSK